jgi:phage terminase small subunit
MPGRPAKPIGMHLYDGKKHLTKAEIKHRQENEIRLGTPDLKMPPSVRRNPVAKKKWKELEELYKGFDFVSSSDVGIISQLCLAYAELDNLLGHLRTLELIEPFDPLEKEEVEREWSGKMGQVAIRNMWRKIDFCISMGGILAVNKAIDAKRSIIRSLEDRLYLNPLAKNRNVPKKPAEKPEETPLQKAGFGNV